MVACGKGLHAVRIFALVMIPTVHLERCGRDDCAEWLTLLNPQGLSGTSAFCFANGTYIHRRWKRMKKRNRKRVANAVMVIIIALIVFAAVYFVGRLRGWF